MKTGPKPRPLMQRLLNRTEKTSSCWFWLGARKPNGYGFISLQGGKKILHVHRLAYTLFKGKIPPGLLVCHSCDNRNCVNPKHLWTGTHKDNAQDMVDKKRLPRGEHRAHAILTEAKVRRIKAKLHAGHLSQTKIAEQFRISPTTISQIHRGLKWAHVESPPGGKQRPYGD